ncbi:MAG: UbiD family decarboxylase [Chloroflexi bacterium]|nr:UbiD family decarboxylase [Chloroflexota bacterium]
MAFTDLQSYIRRLEKEGQLQRVQVEVDPELEITEIATRAVREARPALLFENVKGSRYPLAINLLASKKRIELALGRDPEEIGEELVRFAQDVNPPSLGALWRNRKTGLRLLKMRPKIRRSGPAQEIIEEPDLSALPTLKCWPGDGGRFITLPLVFSRDPETGDNNVGMYRMQVYNATTTGMHMQIQKGGGFHYFNAEKMNQPLEMAVALGGDPALILASVMALPEGMDEAAFAGIVRGARTPMTRGKSVNLSVPANAEFILEGTVRPGRRRLEGPFGDHFGHYSEAAEFPVFEIRTVTRRKNAIYPATVVGKPPQEDRYIGDATQQILSPLIRLMHREIKGMWAYYEAGFHNLLVVSVESRYKKEPIKTALSILGEGQLSLSKCIILVGPDVNPRDPSAVLQAIRRNFRPEEDFHLIARTSADTLDFTGPSQDRGSKMIIDATGSQRGGDGISATALPVNLAQLTTGALKHRLVGRTMLVVQMRGEGRPLLERLVRNPLLGDLSIIVAVSEDVDIDNDIELLWGIFTRFDCARDVSFSTAEFKGIEPVYHGIMAIDATWKDSYPKPLVMDPDVVRKVDSQWSRYWS